MELIISDYDIEELGAIACKSYRSTSNQAKYLALMNKYYQEIDICILKALWEAINNYEDTQP